MSVECENQCPKWAEKCDVKTTFFPDGVLDEKMTPIYQSISSHFRKDIHITLIEAWVNHYQRGCYQDLHDHIGIGSDLSGIMFLNGGPDFSELYFYNRLNTNLTINLSNLLELTNLYTPYVNVGDVLIFPSSFCHGVTRHNSDTVRRTFSFNLQTLKP